MFHGTKACKNNRTLVGGVRVDLRDRQLRAPSATLATHTIDRILNFFNSLTSVKPSVGAKFAAKLMSYFHLTALCT